ncbi:MAG: MarR family transcriptional regulator [Myxococcales bacterium]|nr:MarR family transcriptional regulator [Myxococcales bacterium]
MKDDLLDICRRAARECTANQLRRASRQMTAVFDDAIADSGLRGTQFSLLTALAVGGEMPLSRLAEVLSLDRTTLTRNLAPLERDGLVTNLPSPDGRVRTIAMTQRGLEALERALPRWQAAQNQVMKALGRRRWQELLATLGEL